MVSDFEFRISREVCVWNGTAENKIPLLSWKEKWKQFCLCPFLFFVNTPCFVSHFNIKLYLVFFLAGKGNIFEYEGIGVKWVVLWWFLVGFLVFYLLEFSVRTPPRTPNFLSWTRESKCCQFRPLYSPSSRSPNPIAAHRWEGTPLSCSLAQLHRPIPVAKSHSCFGRESGRIGVSLQSSLILAKRHGWLH